MVTQPAMPNLRVYLCLEETSNKFYKPFGGLVPKHLTFYIKNEGINLKLQSKLNKISWKICIYYIRINIGGRIENSCFKKIF